MKKIFKKVYYKVSPYVISFGSLAIIILLYQKFGGYGVLAFAGVVILVIILRGWKSRWLFIAHLREIETIMFGKPLDKRNWKKGELKQIKLKPKWGKEKE